MWLQISEHMWKFSFEEDGDFPIKEGSRSFVRVRTTNEMAEKDGIGTKPTPFGTIMRVVILFEDTPYGPFPIQYVFWPSTALYIDVEFPRIVAGIQVNGQIREITLDMCSLIPSSLRVDMTKKEIEAVLGFAPMSSFVCRHWLPKGDDDVDIVQ